MTDPWTGQQPTMPTYPQYQQHPPAPPGTGWPTPPARKSRVGLWIAVAAAAVVLVGAAIGGTLWFTHRPNSTGGTFTVTGSLTLYDRQTASEACRGDNGYDDINAGAQVVIYDDTGKTIAVGQLQSGALTGVTTCVYKFTVTGVPVGDGGPYAVEISHRGKLTFPRNQAGAVDMSLGD